jgi:hypothetical protein
MKKIKVFIMFICMILFSISSFAFDGAKVYVDFGSAVILEDSTTILTDASPTWTKTVFTGGSNSIAVSITTDKGLTCTITPLLVNESGPLGAVSNIGTINDTGGSERFGYSTIASQFSKITITKTEAGSMATAMSVVINGAATTITTN